MEFHGGKVQEAARVLGKREGEILDFSANINPLGCSPTARTGIFNCLDSLMHYPDPDAFSLTAALALYHGVDPSSILCGNGSTEFIYLIPQAFEPRRALIVTPAFSEYARALRCCSCEIIHAPLSEKHSFALNVNDLVETLNEGLDMLILANPNSPSGARTPKRELKRLAEAAGRLNIVTVLDEAFIDFCEDDSMKTEISSFPLLILRSMTKFYGIPGIRCGYVLASRDLLAPLLHKKQPWTLNAIAQSLAIDSLNDEQHRQQTLNIVKLERQFLSDRLRAIGGLKVFPSFANYLLVKIVSPLHMSAPSLAAMLFSRGILIRDCSSFKHLGNRFFRIAVRKREENEILLRELERIFAEENGNPSPSRGVVPS
jgi:threonine-phosphate decarboxylase